MTKYALRYDRPTEEFLEKHMDLFPRIEKEYPIVFEGLNFSNGITKHLYYIELDDEESVLIFKLKFPEITLIDYTNYKISAIEAHKKYMSQYPFAES